MTAMHVIFPKTEEIPPIESLDSIPRHLQSLKFAAETRRLPLLIFWIFMGVAVMVAGALAHHRTSWQAFWNQEAVLDRVETIRRIPLGPAFDSFITALNRIFVRGGWVVAMTVIIAIQAFYLALLVVRRDRVPALRFIRGMRVRTMIWIEVGVLMLGTGYFLICTWLFVQIARKFGSCTHPNGTFTFPTSITACPALYKGFDISGHCFLIVHSCLFVLEYAAKVLFVWKCREERIVSASASASASGKDSDVESVISEVSENGNTAENGVKSNTHFNRHRTKYHTVLVILLTCILSLCLSEFLIFLQTILFYHTVLEKVLGTVIGAGYWVGLYLLSRRYPHLF